MMRFFWLFAILTAVSATNGENELPLAQACNSTKCLLPDCRCSSVTIPGGLAARDTPQFVTLTFDDTVTARNIQTYRGFLYNRTNSNGCNIGATFFVNHQYNNYQYVNELYNRGYEIGLHSITHRIPQTFWAQATYEDMVEEFADQKLQMAHFANLDINDIKGIRVPYLQSTGNASFQVIKNHGLVYDSTLGTVSMRNPGLWPYTLDYASIQDCPIGPCPTASIPGVWISPLISWIDLEGFPCFYVDGCIFVPDFEDEERWFEFILTNFERHYLGTRAPFGVRLHEWYIYVYPAVYRAFERFVDLITRLPDVFMVTENEVIEWTKNPVPINEYRQKSCRTFTPSICPASSCSVTAEHNNNVYWMTVCAPCPNTYPWVGNPLGA